ncbi:unnamed protein product [Mycena citricolor]|uniref:Uncharacterized protein n=1 Tax=Mycena citricolor TaxID=2018698 RepID=A0AAD2HTN0_9AGAR|nr:unnamed protein product [Mycena citricolor]
MSSSRNVWVKTVIFDSQKHGSISPFSIYCIHAPATGSEYAISGMLACFRRPHHALLEFRQRLFPPGPFSDAALTITLCLEFLGLKIRLDDTVHTIYCQFADKIGVQGLWPRFGHGGDATVSVGGQSDALRVQRSCCIPAVAESDHSVEFVHRGRRFVAVLRLAFDHPDPDAFQSPHARQVLSHLHVCGGLDHFHHFMQHGATGSDELVF